MTLPGGAGAEGAASGVHYVIQGQRATTTGGKGRALTGPESTVFTVRIGAGDAHSAQATARSAAMDVAMARAA